MVISTLLEIWSAGLVTGINARMVIGKFRLPDFHTLAVLNVGIASTLGFLVVGMIMQFGFGWEVGKPVPGRYEMLAILQWCNIGAALAGGAALGMVLVKGQETNNKLPPPD